LGLIPSTKLNLFGSVILRILRHMADLEIQRAGADQLDLVRQLFSLDRATRHCWCTAFCSSSWQFATGWFGGGNRRRFEAMASTDHAPMGILALNNREPVGWCACGPRARYTTALAGRSHLLAQRPREDDDQVWLIACVFVRPDHRGLSVAVPLLRGAVLLAREEGGSAIEAWPLAAGVARRPGDVHVGRERVFARLGFRCVQRPSAERAIMRLDLADPTR
jgi:GNAT superfamily N-acetyltransferase